MNPSSCPANASSAQTHDYHDRIPYLIGAVANLLSSGGSRLYRSAFGIGLAEWRLMWVMGHESPLTARRASQIMGVDKGATSRALAGLERRGLVCVTVDRSDSRQRVIELSSSGRDLHDRIMVVSQERERRLHAAFTEDELATLRALLIRLLAHAPYVSAFDPARLIETGTSAARRSPTT
jgi:DNA-binding MarR family transcriptional regulator